MERLFGHTPEAYSQGVYFSRLSMSSGYLAKRCISIGIRSLSSKRRHNGLLAASCKAKIQNGVHREGMKERERWNVGGREVLT